MYPNAGVRLRWKDRDGDLIDFDSYQELQNIEKQTEGKVLSIYIQRDELSKLSDLLIKSADEDNFLCFAQGKSK